MELVRSDVEHSRALLHLPPDTRDFTGRADQVEEVARLLAAATRGLHDLMRDFATECLAEAEHPSAPQQSLARLAEEYIGAARLASTLVHPPPSAQAKTPSQPPLAEDVVRADQWAWFTAERGNLIALVERLHVAGLSDRTCQLAALLPAMFDWRADWRAWEHTHQLALDAARQAADAQAEAVILRSLGALYRELGRYDEAVTMLTKAAQIFGDRTSEQAAALRSLGDTYRYQGRLAEAIDAFAAALAVFQAGNDTRSVAGVLNGMADAYRGMSRWDEARAAFETCIGIYHDLDDRLEEARARIRFALVFRDQCLGEQALSLTAGGLQVVRDLGDRRWEARATRQLAIVHRNDGDTATAIGLFGDCMAIFGELGDALWAARVLAGQASLASARGADPAALLSEARQICHQHGITSNEKITSALREW